MKKITLLALLLLFLGSAAFGYTLKQESVLDGDSLRNVLGGDKFVSLKTVRFSAYQGDLFILARDINTRRLDWFLVNPFQKRVIRKGTCPFKVFTDSSISPMSNSALVFTRYPTAIWHLDLQSGAWKMLFKNGADNELFITSLSPIVFADPTWAYTVLDKRDKEGFVIDSIVVAINPSPFDMSNIVSLKQLLNITMSKVFGGSSAPRDRTFQTDLIRFGGSRSFAYILKSKESSKKGKSVDYILVFRGGGIELLDKVEGRILPLDYSSDTSKVLYRANTGKRADIVLFEGGKKTTLMEGNAIVGRIMKDGLVGVTIVKGRSLSIYLGKAPDKLTKVYDTKEAYSTGFIGNGQKIFLMDDSEIKCFRINP